MNVCRDNAYVPVMPSTIHLLASGSTIHLLAPNNVEFIRFEPDGKVYVRGELVDDNMAVYEAFKAWLAKVNQ